MNKVKQKDLLLYSGLIILGLAAPFLFPGFKVQLTILCVLIVLAMTWNLQGGEMGYNTFGNILFYGLGMYLTASVQVGMFFPLAEWTESGGEKTFVHTTSQYFQGMGVGLLVAALVPTIIAGAIGYAILGLRGHYFAICTLGLGIAAGEIAGGIEIIGAGQGFTTPPFPKDIVDPGARGDFFLLLSFVLLIGTFVFIKWIYGSRFKLILNAIRDNEDKAEAMGIQTMKYKIVGWMVSAFFAGLAGGIMGGLIGYIDSTDVAFDGREMGVFMVLMAILGGKGTLWGPVIGATLFHFLKEGFWTLILGWQYVALGVLIVVIVIYFPEGLMGWLREKYPERFGEVIDEKDRKAQVEIKMSILEVKNVSKSFGGVQANVDISVSVEQGSIVGLIGPNGSGKTTLFNSIVGTHPIDQGSIIFDNTEVSEMPVPAVAKLGLLRTFQQTKNLFKT